MKKQCLFCLIALFLLRGLSAQPAPTPQWRPVYHFTPEKNWTNDPNGLVYLNGKYHLFNQQNPFGNQWGHMSWGHATSEDLIHWEHHPIAIPEQLGRDTTWIFSGCNVWDKNNSSGFCKDGGCLVAVYTADQPNLKKESQFIAYSNDGGMSYTPYAGNPVIDLHLKDFRDPNVTWYEPASRWIMIVSLPAENKVRFYASADLKSWIFLSDFGPEGLTPAVWECPFLIQLPVEGKPGMKKWVILNSVGGTGRGAFMQYFVGEFNGRAFRNDNPASLVLPVDYGDCFYAAIPWTNLPGPEKTMVGWLVPGPQATYPWTGQMSIPRDLMLRETGEGLRLIQKPAAIISRRLPAISGGRMMKIENQAISNQSLDLKHADLTAGNAYWLRADMVPGAGVTAGFRIAQEKDADGRVVAETVIAYDQLHHRLLVDRSHAGDSAGMNQDRLLQVIDVAEKGKSIRLDILLDRSSLEVFLNDGEKVLSTHIFPGAAAHGVSAFATGGSVNIKSLQLWDLSNPR